MKNKFVSVIFCLLSLSNLSGAIDLGLVGVNDTINFPLVCLDTLGRSGQPDSVHVLCWYNGQGADAYTYAARNTAPKSTSYIDSVSVGGAEYLYFVDLVDHIDSNAAEGPYSGQVVLWYQDEPTANPFCFTKVANDAPTIVSRIDSLLLSLGFDTTSVQAKIGRFGSTDSSPTQYSLNQWLDNSLGIDGVNDLHGKIDNLSISGGGTEPETLVVVNSVDSTLIQGARATIRTLDQSTVKINGLSTDLNGQLIIDMDAGDYFAAIFANNCNPCLDTLTVEQGGGTDTLWLTSFDPGNPQPPGLCRVFGWIYDLSGQPVADAEITAEIPSEYHPLTFSGTLITPFKLSVATDSLGYWQIDLLPNSLMSNPDSRYYFTIKYPSGIIMKTITEVPALPGWQLE